MTPGKVNIVIPLYNQEEYIKQCVTSALNQTYKNFDVTVINDGSTDHSRDVLRELVDYWNQNDRLRLPVDPTDVAGKGHWDFDQKLKIVDQDNQGLSESRNTGIRAGDGEFILPLDSDDWIEPNYLAKTIPQMADHNIGIVSTDMQYEGLLHNRIRPRGLTLEDQMHSNNLPVCSLIRREAYQQTNGYETIFVEIAGSQKSPGYEDWNMWIDILKRGWKVAVVNEPLFHYRVKPISMISHAKAVHKGLVRVIHLLHPELYKGK